ncbi:MAG: hypothetical protein KDA27_24875, partial [Candidatus Eisenbacteria bacterium]|nr:hypothetical protein [Candidatus Eisenbacteria bacterium]
WLRKVSDSLPPFPGFARHTLSAETPACLFRLDIIRLEGTQPTLPRIPDGPSISHRTKDDYISAERADRLV